MTHRSTFDFLSSSAYTRSLHSIERGDSEVRQDWGLGRRSPLPRRFLFRPTLWTIAATAGRCRRRSGGSRGLRGRRRLRRRNRSRRFAMGGIGDVEAGSFEDYAGSTIDDAANLFTAGRALLQWIILHALKCFKGVAARFTLILVRRHYATLWGEDAETGITR